jgi:peptide deformylase
MSRASTTRGSRETALAPVPGRAGGGEQGPRRPAAPRGAGRASLLLIALPLLACATSGAVTSSATSPLRLTAEQWQRVRGQAPLPLVTRGSAGAAVLRRRAQEVPAELRLELLAAAMERSMRAAKGVGIAGPQVGVPLRVAVLLLGYRGPSPRAVFVRNPVILERADETVPSYEGCLSVPGGVGGLVRRSRWVRVRFVDTAGQPGEVRAEGPDAILWQHELDHLDGVLFVDRLVGELIPQEEMRRRRRALESAPSAPATAPRR